MKSRLDLEPANIVPAYARERCIKLHSYQVGHNEVLRPEKLFAEDSPKTQIFGGNEAIYSEQDCWVEHGIGAVQCEDQLH